MAKSIEEYTAEVSKSYDNSRNALQNQINAIEGNLATTQKQINENYANQQNLLNNQRNQAASSASMQAAGSGGSFGGRANIANKKYYEQAFVPAQTQLNTNQSQALENAQTQANNNRLTLESQLASLNDEISRQGLARYYDELERERQAELQRRAIAAQYAAANNYGIGSTQEQDRYYNAGSGNNYQFRDSQNGGAVKFGTFISQYGGDFNQRARDYLYQMAKNGDANAALVLGTIGNKQLVNGYSPMPNNVVNQQTQRALNILGLRVA